MIPIKKKFLPHCADEYGKLQKVLVCPPEFLKISQVINETQKYYIDRKIHIDVQQARKQHRHFVQVLQANGIEVVSLPTSEVLNEQVFVRDVGFVIGKQFIVADMKYEIRKKEKDILLQWCRNVDLNVHHLEHVVEGGDIVLDDHLVWVGRGSRTTQEGIDELRTLVEEREVHIVNFDEKYLHLDCIFNVLSPTEAIFYRDAFDKQMIRQLEKRYYLIEVTSVEQFALATNVLCIDHNKVISHQGNTQINQQLSRLGYEVIEVDYSEMLKSGGSFRCTSLPLLRAKGNGI